MTYEFIFGKAQNEFIICDSSDKYSKHNLIIFQWSKIIRFQFSIEVPQLKNNSWNSSQINDTENQ